MRLDLHLAVLVSAALVLPMELALAAGLVAQQGPPPIIYVHLHALPAEFAGPPPNSMCVNPGTFPALDPRDSWARSSRGSWPNPAASMFSDRLRRIVDAGFRNRVMFGSDQMIWPEAIEIAIEAIEGAEFLTAQQKRAILHDNAVRFLRIE